MKNKILRTDRLLAALVALLALFAAPQAEAQTTYTWTNTGSSTTFLQVAQWQTNGVTSTTAPTNSTSIARFTNSTNLATIGINLNTVSGTLEIGSILKQDSGNITLNNSSTTVGGQMRISGTGAETNLLVSLGTGTLTLTNGSSRLMDLQLATSGTINVSNSAGHIRIFSLIKQDSAESNGFTKTGAGTLTIGGTNANTYSGLTTLSAGTLLFNKTAGLNVSGGDILASAGTLLLANSNQMSDSSALTNAGGTVNFGGFTDTIGSFVQSGGTFTNGTLTASTYALQGGTVAGNLGAGTATVTTGTTALNGTLSATTVNVNSGTMNLGSANRLADAANVTIAGGTLGMGANNDTVGTLTISSGTLGGSGTLTAASYSLQGGTIDANVGAGAATNSAGTTTLNGTLGTTNLVVSGGTINLGSANRLDNGLALTISGGTLGLGANSDTVGSFAISSGALDGSGTITASTYALNGGTVTGNLGAGTINVGGSAALNGTAAATAINVNSGTLTLGSGSRLAGTTPTVTMAGGTLALGGAETIGSLTGSSGTVALDGNTLTIGAGNATSTYSGGITGTGGGLTKTGNGVLTLAVNASYTGATTINAGTLVYNGTNTSTAVAVNSGATLAGGGSVGATTINSGGTMNPGNSPGTQTYASLTWEGGANYNWQLYNATGVAGTDYDTFVSTGAFTINATSGNKFNINLWTLSGIGPDTNGSALNFNAATSTNWTLGTFGSISGFSADAFAINPFATNGTGGFANLFTGTFTIDTNATSLLLVYTAPAVGDEFEWSAGSGNWNTGGNWTNNSVPPETGAKIYYSGAGGLSTNDVATAINGLTFMSGAGAYTVDGDPLTMGVLGVVNESTAVQTVDVDITLGGAQIFDAASGDLVFGGAVNNDSHLLTVDGASDVSLNGIVSGSGGLTKLGSGSLMLGGNNTFSGALAVNAGTVLVNGAQTATTLNIGGGVLLLGATDVLANGATLTLSSGGVNLGGFSDTVSTYSQVSGTITNGSLAATTYNLTGGTMGAGLNGGAVNVGGAVSLSGAITNGASVNITNGTLTYAANDRIGDNSTVTVNGGALDLATFSDTIDVYNQVAGTITNGSLAATTYSLTGGTVGAGLNGGAVNVGGNVTLSGTITNGASVNITNGTLTYAANDRLGDNVTVTNNGGTLNLATFSDTISTYNQVAGSITNGSLAATTYNLTAGTMGAGLNGGTVNVGGNVSLSGTITNGASVNITNGGTLTLGSANRISENSTVTVNGGLLDLATFSDTISIYNQVGGTITNGALVATTYNLDGGTVATNTTLGAGTANVANGTVTLNGSLAATTLNIGGGTLALGANGRIDNATVVNLSSGVLDMGTFIDGVGTFNMTGGSVNGTGANSLTAINGLNLQAGTINANIGNSSVAISNGTTTINGTVGGAVTVSSGTANLGGALNSSLTAGGGTANLSNTVAGNVTVSGGTMNLSAADLIGNASTVNVSSGALNLNGNDSVGAVTVSGGTVGGSGVLTGTSYAVQAGTISAGIGGSGAMTKTGAGTATLAANNTTTFSGAVAVNSGALLATTSGALGSGAVTISEGSTLAGAGVTLSNNFTIGTASGTQSLYSQNFNGMGTNSTAALPTDWKMSAAGAGTTSTFWTNSGNLTATTQQASSGTPNSGGRYNWGFSNDVNNRAIGFMSSGSYAEPNSIMFAFTNTTGQTLTNLTVSFDYLRFRTNTTAISNVFYVSDSTTSWGTAINTNNWSTGTAGYNFAPTAVSLSNNVALNLVNGGVAYFMWTFDPTTTGNSQGLGLDNFLIEGAAPASGSGTLGIDEAGSATFSGNIVNNNAATFTAASGGTATFSGAISGLGTVTKTGAGTVTLSGASANTFSGMTTVSAGTLQLSKSTDVAAIAGNITVNTGATLLLSSSGNVANTSAVTLSGGTILRDGGVSEVFGALTLGVTGGTLDFGTGATGTLGFGEYAPSALLTINNFFQGNTLTFGSDLSGSINNASLFSFDNGFTSSWSSGTSTFTITAIPEPSTYLAAAGLLGLMLWPSRKRLIKDAKKILGFTPPMRDRLARRASEG
jgi:autotransporter-associated beta strand protein